MVRLELEECSVYRFTTSLAGSFGVYPGYSKKLDDYARPTHGLHVQEVAPPIQRGTEEDG